MMEEGSGTAARIKQEIDSCCSPSPTSSNNNVSILSFGSSGQEPVSWSFFFHRLWICCWETSWSLQMLKKRFPLLKLIEFLDEDKRKQQKKKKSFEMNKTKKLKNGDKNDAHSIETLIAT